MRIILVCPTYYGYDEVMTRSLAHLGHDVSVLSYFRAERIRDKIVNRLVHEVAPRLGLGALSSGRIHRFNDTVLRESKRHCPDVIVIVKGELLFPETLDELSRSAPVVYWAFDDPYRYDAVIDSLEHFSVVASFSRSDTERLCADGMPAHYVPLGFASDVFFPNGDRLDECDVRDISFVGARYESRERLLFALLGAGKLGIWGGDWKRRPWRVRYWQRRTVLDDACMGWADLAHSARVYGSCTVNLNAHGPWDGLNMRTFEIPGAGGFQLCDAQAGVEEFFEPGKEIILYRDPEEARALSEYYLRAGEERERIRLAGMRRAWRDHTLAQRMRTLLDRVSP